MENCTQVSLYVVIKTLSGVRDRWSHNTFNDSCSLSR